jgi:hypothetical protein
MTAVPRAVAGSARGLRVDQLAVDSGQKTALPWPGPGRPGPGTRLATSDECQLERQVRALRCQPTGSRPEVRP